MVSQDSPPHPSSNILHQFIISDSITNQTQFENQHFDPYVSAFRGGGIAFPPSLSVLPSIQSLGERMSRSIDLVQAPRNVAEESEMSQTRHLMDLLGAANESNQHAQRLSLSLGPHMFVPPVQYRQRALNSDVMNQPSYLLPGEEAREACNVGVGHVNDGYSFVGSGGGLASSSSSISHRSVSTLYGDESLSTVIGQSRYLKPAQLLLEEIVNIGGKAVEISNEKYVGKLCGGGRRGGATSLSSELKAELCSSSGALSADKHELQMKIAKLIALLEEVEGRYERYYNQMEEVMGSFEMIAGRGAAKCYTSLALQAMSRHFDMLRDAIISHINVERKKLLQDLPKISTGLSKLSLLDRESRMSLQQLGMVQSQRQAWRPIRGLPENSVTILRAWLFEHFLHPYPSDSEKMTLASQTGLSKNQVSNWFINARVRLWKPMIEEMYKEEFGDSSEDSNPLASGSMTGEAVTDHEED